MFFDLLFDLLKELRCGEPLFKNMSPVRLVGIADGESFTFATSNIQKPLGEV